MLSGNEKYIFSRRTHWRMCVYGRYAPGLPLFFVVVKTNVDYQTVGSFVVQSETTDAIFEALSVLKSWNQKWNPRVSAVAVVIQ